MKKALASRASVSMVLVALSACVVCNPASDGDATQGTAGHSEGTGGGSMAQGDASTGSGGTTPSGGGGSSAAAGGAIANSGGSSGHAGKSRGSGGSTKGSGGTGTSTAGKDGGSAGTSQPEKEASILGDVAFSTPSQTFKGQIQVELTTSLAGAEIRYTVDGQLPTASSTAYAGKALTLKATTQLRAQAFVGGKLSGLASTALYVARTVDPTSDLPIVLVEGYGKGKPCNKKVYYDAAVMIWEPVNGVASMASLPTLAARAGYHVRGFSSSTFPQSPYKIEFRDNSDKDIDYPVLGMPADSDWALIAPYYDRTLLRNPFTYELGKEMGLEVPRSQYAEVYVNNADRPVGEADYQGIYWISETIKNNSGRTNLKQLKETDTALPKISGGYIFKFDQMAAEEPRLYCTGSNLLTGGTNPPPGGAGGAGGSGGSNKPSGGKGGGAGDNSYAKGCPMDMLMGGTSAGKTTGAKGTCWTDLEVVDPDQINEQQKAWLTDYVQQFHDSLHKTPIGDYAQYIDVATFADNLIVNELTFNSDAYVKSAYFFKDRDGKLKAGPLWDYNFALGGVGATEAAPTKIDAGWRYKGQRNMNNWYPKLMSDPSFAAEVKKRYTELRKTLLSEEAIGKRIDKLCAPLKQAVVRDYAKWPPSGMSGGFGGTGSSPATWDGQVQVMRDFLKARLVWMDANLP